MKKIQHCSPVIGSGVPAAMPVPWVWTSKAIGLIQNHLRTFSCEIGLQCRWNEDIMCNNNIYYTNNGDNIKNNLNYWL